MRLVPRRWAKVGVALEVRREVGAGEGDAVAAFGDEEGGADDAGVLAEEVGAGGEGVGLVQAGEDAVLAGHVVGAGGDGAEGRAAEDVFVLAEAEQVGEVGVAAGEAPDLRACPRRRGGLRVNRKEVSWCRGPLPPVGA